MKFLFLLILTFLLTGAAFATEAGKCKLKGYTSLSCFALKKEKKIIHDLTWDECVAEGETYLSQPSKKGLTFKRVKVIWSDVPFWMYSLSATLENKQE